MSRLRLATLTYLGSLLNTAVTLAVGLLATPYLVDWLGEGRYGAARAAIDLYGFLTLLEFGLGGTIGPLLARALGQGDEHALRQTVAAGVRAYLWVTIPIVLVGASLELVLDRLIPPPSSFTAAMVPAFRADLHRGWLVGLAGWLAVFLIPLRALTEAGQRGYRVHAILTAQALATTALMLAMARAGWGITGQLTATALGGVATASALAWDALRRHPGLFGALRSVRDPDPEARRAIWALSRPTLVFNVSSRLGLLSDNLIVASMLGTDRVTALVLTIRLATLAQQQLQGIGNASWPALAEMHARGEHDEFNRRLVELTGLVTVLGVAGLGPVVAFNGRFMALWLGARDVDAGTWVALVGAVNALGFGVFSLWNWCFAGTGRVGRIATPIAVGSVANLIISIALTPVFGVAGPLLGTTSTFLAVYCTVLPARLRRDFGTRLAPLFRAVAIPSAWGVAYTLALRWVALHHDPASFFDRLGNDHARRLAGLAALAVEMALSALLFVVVVGQFLLGPEDRARLRRRFVGGRSARGEPVIVPEPPEPGAESP
ncbi:MAG TPA: polysaccharide biosynthesis C-terminal domain-containing protein [Isosphaeraceae bacterium]|jgi:O-antigen/teichoic acid export membrane protein|nr:polysaccharide biosynthesis C-terminal domain-containing protein [Isosphaeraceae bacterium]